MDVIEYFFLLVFSLLNAPTEQLLQVFFFFNFNNENSVLSLKFIRNSIPFFVVGDGVEFKKYHSTNNVLVFYVSKLV